MLGCIHALLLAKASTQLLDLNGNTALRHAEARGQTASAEPIRQHAPPPLLASVAARPSAGKAAVSPPASLPRDIHRSAHRGELQKVVKWLGKEGHQIDALCSAPTLDGGTAASTLLDAAATHGHLEMVRELLTRGASVDLQSSLGYTALMGAAVNGHLSTLLLLLQHSANPDLQNLQGHTALMAAAGKGQEACVQALLRAEANTQLLDKRGRTALQWAEAEGHTAIAELIRQHAAPPPSAALAAAPPHAVEPATSPPASLPVEIYESAQWGELPKVTKWLNKGGLADALYTGLTRDGGTAASTLLHRAATYGHLEMVRELLKRGASVDLQSSFGDTTTTALMGAALNGHLSILLLLLKHSANPDLQTNYGETALMMAAGDGGHEACVQILLRAGANTELLDKNGNTALQWAKGKRRACRPCCEPGPTPSCSTKTATPPCSAPRSRATRASRSSSDST